MTSLPTYNAMPALTPYNGQTPAEQRIIDQMRNADPSTWGSAEIAEHTRKMIAQDSAKGYQYD